MERNGLVTTAIARMRTRRLSFRTTLKASHPFGLKIFFPFVLSLLPKISLRQYLCLISDRSLVGFHTSSTPNTRNRNRVLRSYGMEILGEVVFSRKGRRWGERNLHERLNWTRKDSAWYSISRILRQPPHFTLHHNIFTAPFFTTFPLRPTLFLFILKRPPCGIYCYLYEHDRYFNTTT